MVTRGVMTKVEVVIVAPSPAHGVELVLKEEPLLGRQDVLSADMSGHASHRALASSNDAGEQESHQAEQQRTRKGRCPACLRELTRAATI